MRFLASVLLVACSNGVPTPASICAAVGSGAGGRFAGHCGGGGGGDGQCFASAAATGSRRPACACAAATESGRLGCCGRAIRRAAEPREELQRERERRAATRTSILRPELRA